MVYRRTKRGSDEKYPHYYYRFMREGRPIRVNTKQSNRRTAEELEAAHKTRLARGEADLPSGKTPTLAEFNPVLTSKTGKKKSAQFYADRMRALLAYEPLANARLDRIDQKLIETYVASRRRKDPAVREPGKDSPATINRSLATLHKVLHLAFTRKPRLIFDIPKITKEPGEGKREFVLAPGDDERKYLDACPDPLHDIAVLILSTGLRLGEATNLMWADIDFKRGRFEVICGKTPYAERTLDLTPVVTEMLLRRQKVAVNKWVFGNEAETGPAGVNSVGHMHARVRRRLKLDPEFVIHSLRHTALTRFGDSGTDAFVIKRIAGHASITTSEKYVHTRDEAMTLAFRRRMEAEGRHNIGTHGIRVA